MPRIDVQVPTSDGVSKGTLHVPDGAGPWPGVLVFTDIFGTRDDFLSMRDRLAGLGYVGYCMGRRLALVAAGGIGGKLAAAASFHAARVAVPDDPSSPHQAADQIRAAVLVAGSIEDAGFTQEHAALLDGSLAAAGVRHTVEIWPGHHGFAVPDMPVYDEALYAEQLA
jgi:carboxymethylenebutenolidase